MTQNNNEKIFLVAIFCVGIFLFFTNLGNIYLWQDEAQTALISQTILQDGIPRGYDGKNFFSQELGAEYGENYLFKWHTWLPFYIVAAFLKIFGNNTLAARLPFALFGLGSVFFLYYLTKSLFKDNRTAYMAALVLLFSIPFLVLSRQCRYYSMTAFFSLMTMYGYQEILKKEKKGPIVYFVGASFLFHTQYIYVATLLAALGLHLLIFHRNKWRNFLLPTLAILVLNSPWIIWLSGIKYGEQYGASFFTWQSFLWKITNFIKETVRFIFNPLLLLLPPAVFLYNLVVKKLTDIPTRDFLSSASLAIFFIGSTLLALSLSAPAPFFRYLAPLLPFFAMLIGIIFAYSMSIHPFAGIVFLSSIIGFSPIKEYFFELTHDYNGPIEGIVNYLNEHADEDDIVAITYGDMPVKFYTGLRVIGGLTGENLEPAKDADWVIIRRNVISYKDYMVRNFLVKNINWQKYHRIILKYPDIPFENRESPDEHLYRTETDSAPVVLFRKSR